MDFNILACRRFVAEYTHNAPKRLVHNYEFDLYLKSQQSVTIDGITSSVSNGYICFKKPGQIVSSTGNFDRYILTVDFSKNTPIDNYRRNTAQYTEPLSNNPLITNIPNIFVPRHVTDLTVLFDVLSKQVNLNSPSAHLCFEEILHIINADLLHSKRKLLKSGKTPADDVLTYINKNFYKQLTLNELADLACINKSYLVRLFKSQYGATPVEYLIQCRINHAKDLLVNTGISIEEIAAACGYNNSSFFYTQFKSIVGITPLQYRKKVSI